MQDRRSAPSSASLDQLFDPDAPLSYEDRLEMLIAAALPHAGPRLSFGSEIARGGMGAVKTAFDEVLQRRMAAKTMHARTYEHLVLVHGFLREAQVTGQLDHPNIVPIHELGRDAQGQLYFTMKLVEGKSLKSLIGGEPATDQDRLITLLEHFLKVCDALAFAHSRGVIHCDIKSANVMVGGYGEVYLMDWGGAQILPPKPGADEQWVRDTLPSLPDSETQGLVFGTPSYMSPEQASGGRLPLDERSDVFSMGALMYEIMTGKPPYVAPTAMEALMLAQQAEVRPPDAIVGPGAFPRELVRIVMKALEPHPDDRYQTVGELRFDIIKLLRGSGGFPVVRFAAGEHVIREGEDGDAAYIVQSGRLQVYKADEDGARVDLRVLGPGDMFGETAIFARSRRTASVVCVEPAILQRITSDLIEQEMASMKPWMGKLIQTLAARFGGVAPAPMTPQPTRAAAPTARPRAPEPPAAESVVIDIDEVSAEHDGDLGVSAPASKA
jgi:serine/threonine-protein kinase